MKTYQWSLLILLLLLSGCVKNDNREIAANGNDTFVFGISEPVETFDPADVLHTSDRIITSLLYEGLVGIDEENKVIPLIAESWSSDSARLVWTFKIRDSIFFHDDPCFPNNKGRKVNSADVRYIFERLASRESHSPYSSLFTNRIAGFEDFAKGLTDSIAGISLLDSSHIQIRLTKPYITFLKSLSLPACYLIPGEAVKHYGADLPLHPVGTGPFKLAVIEPLKKITLLKNKHYWRKKKDGSRLPLLEKIELYIRPASTGGYIEFKKGKQHLLLCNGVLYEKLSSGENFNQKFSVRILPHGLSVRFMAFSMKGDSPLADNLELRKAVTNSLDRSRLEKVIPRHYVPASSYVPESLLGEPFDYRRIPEDEISLVYDNVSRLYREIHIVSTIQTPALSLLNENLEQAGFTPHTSIQTINYYEDISEKHPDIFRVSYKPILADPEEYYLLFYSKSEPTLNLSGFSDERYDRLLEQAMIESSNEKRRALFLQLERILSDQVALIPLSHEKEQYMIYPKNISGISLLNGMPDLRLTRFVKE